MMEASVCGADMSARYVDLSKKFLRICGTGNYKAKLFNDPNFSELIVTLIKSDHEEALIPTLQGLQKLVSDPCCCKSIQQQTHIIKCLQSLRKRFIGNDQLDPVLLSILNTLNPPQSQLNSSFVSVNESRRQGFNKRFGGARMQNFSNLKYTIFVPGVSNSSVKRKVESLLIRTKGVKSFSIDSKNEIVHLYTNPEFRIALVAKILSVYANIDEIFLVLNKAGKPETRVPVTASCVDEDPFNTTMDASFCSKRRVVDPRNIQKPLGWTTSIGNFISRSFYW